jgi:hypothetical protein
MRDTGRRSVRPGVRVAARELADFCYGIGIPFGFNVESVSIRKEEIDASAALAASWPGRRP